MPQFIVVENKKDWPLEIPETEIVSAREYLTNRRFVDMKRAKVFNLCRNYGYQTLGYYVSLLAAARNHRPLPSLGTIQNLRHSAVVRIASDDLEDQIHKCLHSLKSEEFELSIYFGRNLASRYDRLCQALFDHFPAPLLRAKFHRNGAWRLVSLDPISSRDIPESHREFVIEQAKRYFERPRERDVEQMRYDLAILVNPEEIDAPSDAKAIERFIRAARKVGIRASVIGKEEYGRIGEYDALFIRETTGVNHRTFRFASRAEKEGLVVIDDAESILRCCNKVYQAELFEKHGIPCPRTLVVHAGNREQVGPALGYPVVLKRPDSSFSMGVVKAKDEAELKDHLERFFKGSDLVVAQSFAASEFDWRVGVLDGKPLYVCKYYMARGHWQIQKSSEDGKRQFGRNVAFPVDEAPPAIVELGVRAANLIGRGLYGVDIKEVDGRLLVMEVNDNPSIEAGIEDSVLKDELYLRIMRCFYERMEQRGRTHGTSL
ncbi:MAG TPA: RimK family protein [Polyangiaceae bacterium]|nr:RimK family protein [Polyangiaceae bacterium]